MYSIVYYKNPHVEEMKLKRKVEVMKIANKTDCKIKIVENGPYLVTGSIPLSEK